MKGETQALHLAKMMQRYNIPVDHYELALPLVMVRRSKLKKLQVNDVLLLGLKALEFVLIDGETVCAKLLPKKVASENIIEIIDVSIKPIESIDSNKYEILRISFGMYPVKDVSLGYQVEMTEINIDNVRLMLGDKKLAEGSLVMTDHKIAVKINKVIV